MATKTFYDMHTHTTWRRPICQLANCTPVSICAGSCITSALSAGTPAPTCNDMRKRCSESARPILQRQTRQLQANRTHESLSTLPCACAKFSTPRLDLRHNSGKMGRAGHRTLLSETRQPWPQTRSMKCTRTHTHTPGLGVLQHVNLQIAHQFQYVPDPASPQRCQLAHPHLPAMTCENAVLNQQGQSFKGKQGKPRQIAHMNLNVNSAMRVPNLALRTWTCGTAAATGARASSILINERWVRSQLQV